MKSIGKAFLFLIVSIIGITQVHAFEEYGIVIEDTTVTVYNENHIEISSPPAGIYSYNSTSKVLTLTEGVHYVYVENNNDTSTVTSDGKKVYLNMLYGKDLTIDNLYSETYTTAGTYVWDYFDSNHEYPIITHFHGEELLIKNSKIKLAYGTPGNVMENLIHTTIEGTSSLGKITIQSSTVETIGAIMTNNHKDIVIKDHSTVKTIYLGTEEALGNSYGTEKLDVQDSRLEVSMNEIVDNGAVIGKISASVDISVISIKNSSIITNGLWNTNSFTMTSSSMGYNDDLEKFDARALVTIEAIITNSMLDLSGAVICNDLTLTNSSLFAETGPNSKILAAYEYDGSTQSALIVENLSLTNSNFRAVSKGDVPALILKNDIETDKDRFVLINNDFEILEYKKVNLNNYGFFNNPNNYSMVFNDVIQSQMTEGYTGLLNDSASKYVMSAETVDVTLKVVGGTWEDGTTDDKVMTIVLGQIIDEDFIKTVPSKTNQELKVERTGDYEYTYTYKDIVNPKTGVASLSFLLIVCVLCIMAFIYYKNELSLFKKL